jgi:general secretion pathway protein B
MSILLDALKKSEEQRQLGKTPSIHSPSAEPGGGAPGAQQWVPLTLIAVSAIAMAWIGWQQFRLPAEPAGPASVAEVRMGTQLESPAGTGRESATESEAARERSTVELAADGSGPPEADAGAGDGQQEPAAAGSPQAALRTPVESFRPETKALRNVTVMPPDLQADGQPEQQVNRSPEAREAKPQAPQRAFGEAEPEVAAAAPPRQSRSEPQVTEPHVAEPISYWELPQGIRDSLPEMHVSVLVYAERPQDRFVLVSGQRMVEKDVYEGSVILEEIRRDGAVFQYQNYRFLVKG